MTYIWRKAIVVLLSKMKGVGDWSRWQQEVREAVVHNVTLLGFKTTAHTETEAILDQ